MKFYKGHGGPAPQTPVPVRNSVLDARKLTDQADPSKYRLIDPAVETDPDHVPDEGQRNGRRVVRAVNTALTLGLPLLVSGEPGSGKTQLGYGVANELGLATPLKFTTKSSSEARDLFYEYDAVRHFQAAQADPSVKAVDFIEYTALGLAILLALPFETRAPFLSDALRAGTIDPGLPDARKALLTKLSAQDPVRSLVVIDEIDKAPRDFPNDLLHEIETLSFRAPELGGIETPAIDPDLKPIIIITTNSERQLPDAFLRRCAYAHIDYPRGQALAAIIDARLGQAMAASSPFAEDVRAFYEKIRAEGRIDKAPGTAELLQFLQVMIEQKIKPDWTMAQQPDEVLAGLSLLAKINTDVAKLEDALRSHMASTESPSSHVRRP
ncbi:MAG: MoxR family ATPase [Pseudomonadota bacterium]